MGGCECERVEKDWSEYEIAGESVDERQGGATGQTRAMRVGRQ